MGCLRLDILPQTKYVELKKVSTKKALTSKSTVNKACSPYELSNHLGNVLTVVSDRKIAVDNNNDLITDYYLADVVNATDYTPFGAPMPGRQFNSGNYRYGFNGQSKDNEIKGDGNSYDFKNRIYDPRLGKFLSTDVVGEAFPFWSPYHFSANNPIWFIDFDGLQPVVRKANYGGLEYTISSSIEDPNTFSVSSENKGIVRLFNKTTSTTLDFTPKGRKEDEQDLESLGLLKHGNCCVLKNTDPDYIRITNTVHKGVNAIKILLAVLEQNPDVELVVIGNHAVSQISTTDMGQKIFGFKTGDKKTLKDYYDQTNEIAFTKDRANTANAAILDGKGKTYSRGEVRTYQFPGVFLDPLGRGSRGISIFFDFSKTKEVKEPEPKTESEGYESYQNPRYLD